MVYEAIAGKINKNNRRIAELDVGRQENKFTLKQKDWAKRTGEEEIHGVVVQQVGAQNNPAIILLREPKRILFDREGLD